MFTYALLFIINYQMLQLLYEPGEYYDVSHRENTSSKIVEFSLNNVRLIVKNVLSGNQISF